MGAVQVVKVADQGLQARGHLEGLQHVAAHKVRQVADRLHRHGLVKQLQRLVVFNAKAPAKPGRIRRKAVVQFCAQAAQPLAKLGHVGAEMGEVRRNRERTLGPQKEACGLPVGFLHPEHLGQCHRLVVACVVENTQDHRVAVGLAQAHRLGRTGDLIAFGFVMPQYVGAQRPLFAVRACSLVVGDAVGRHQQGGDGINQGGLARSNIAREQAVLAVELQRPHPAVEGAPVEHFQPGQPKTRQGVIRYKVQAHGLRLKHVGPLPACRSRRPIEIGSWPGAHQIRPAIGRPQRP